MLHSGTSDSKPMLVNTCMPRTAWAQQVAAQEPRSIDTVLQCLKDVFNEKLCLINCFDSVPAYALA